MHVSAARRYDIQHSEKEIRQGDSRACFYAIRHTNAPHAGTPLGLGLAEKLEEVRHGREAPVNGRDLGHVQLQTLDVVVQIDRQSGALAGGGASGAGEFHSSASTSIFPAGI